MLTSVKLNKAQSQAKERLAGFVTEETFQEILNMRNIVIKDLAGKLDEAQKRLKEYLKEIKGNKYPTDEEKKQNKITLRELKKHISELKRKIKNPDNEISARLINIYKKAFSDIVANAQSEHSFIDTPFVEKMAPRLAPFYNNEKNYKDEWRKIFNEHLKQSKTQLQAIVKAFDIKTQGLEDLYAFAKIKKDKRYDQHASFISEQKKPYLNRLNDRELDLDTRVKDVSVNISISTVMSNYTDKHKKLEQLTSLLSEPPVSVPASEVSGSMKRDQAYAVYKKRMEIVAAIDIKNKYEVVSRDVFGKKPNEHSNYAKFILNEVKLNRHNKEYKPTSFISFQEAHRLAVKATGRQRPGLQEYTAHFTKEKKTVPTDKKSKKNR